jgi:hypothetical protein
MLLPRLPTPRRPSFLALLAWASLLPAISTAAEPEAPPDLTLPEAIGRVFGPARPHLPGEVVEAPYHWTPLPFVVVNPLMGVGFGGAVIGAFRLGAPGTTTFSTFEASGFLTAEGQRGVNLSADVRFPDDRWVLATDLGGGTFPNPAWGLGSDTPESNRTVVRRTQLTAQATLYRLLAGRLYAGLGYAFDGFYGISTDRPIPGEPGAPPYPVGTSGRSQTSSFTLNGLWDGRDVPAAPTRGDYLLVRYRLAPRLFAGDETWRSLYVDGRTYFPLTSRRHVLALRALGWTAFGRPPYLLLPSLGADPEHRTGRGYVEGRFTGKDLLYAEAELRFPIWSFVSGVAAVNLTAVSDRGPSHRPLHVTAVHPALVAGLRGLLSKDSLVSLAFDVAWAPGASAPALYLNASEAF